jgi:hypothetical protein
VLNGNDVVNALKEERPDLRRYRVAPISPISYFGFPGKTTASTAACGTITLSITNIRHDTFLINTIAHENTHYRGLLRQKKVANQLGPSITSQCDRDIDGSLFVDGDYTNATKPWLVSYGLGDLAECFVASGRKATETMACFERVVDGEPACRRYYECCTGAAGKNVDDIRRDSGLCQDRSFCQTSNTSTCS